MHLGNGTVTPACAIYGAGIAALGLGLGLAMAPRSLSRNRWRYAAGTALVFAAQAFNVPILPHMSGHLVGGFLLAYWFGAGAGLAAMSLVLAVQAALGDGTWMTLGLNIVNMGVIPCMVAYPIWKRFGSRLAEPQRSATIAAAAWASVVVASLFCGVELLSNAEARRHAAKLLSILISSHMLVGVLEAAGTIAAISAARALMRLTKARQAALATITVAALLIGSAVVASALPDALESALRRFQIGGVNGQIMKVRAA